MRFCVLSLAGLIAAILTPAPSALARPAGTAMIGKALAVTVQVQTTGPDSVGFTGQITSSSSIARRGGQVAGPRGGAGFIFDASGLVATNAHVLAGAGTVMVRLSDGRRLAARVVGTDAAMDLAVLKIDAATPLPFARFGDSRQADIGAPVWAVGAPMGYAFSVSAGVISGRDRVFDETYAVNLLQHDAALNPGSSGGPLFDAEGKVIGINTATPPETLFDIGIGLAIPVEVARPALLRLAHAGRIVRGQLGLSVTAADVDVASALGATEAGLLIDGLTDSGAARRHGLLAGDLIVALDDRAIATPRDLTAALLNSRPGDRVTVRYVRGGQQASLSVTLDDTAAVAPLPAQVSLQRERPLDIGLTLGASGWNGGVSVVAVLAGSPAATYGLEAGDRLWAVNGVTPLNAAHAMSLMRREEARFAVLRLEHPGRPVGHVVLPLTQSALARRPPGRVIDAIFGPF